MGIEVGVHSLAAGNTSFPNGSGAAPKNVGIFLNNSDAAGFANMLRADVGLFIKGQRGFKSGMHWVDTDGSTVPFDLSRNGSLRTGKSGNAAAPQWTFFDNQDTGVFWAGNNNLGIGTAGTEAIRIDQNQNLGVGSGTVAAGTRLYVTGRRTTLDGNLLLNGASQRIQLDTANGTLTNRTYVQEKTTNAATTLGMIPNRTATTPGVQVLNNSTATNAGVGELQATAAVVDLAATRNGSGTFLPLTFSVNGSERARLDTGGNLGVGGTAPAGSRLYVICGISELAGLKQTAATVLTASISPTQITSDQNNYNPTGLATSRILRLSTDASRNITGLAAQPTGTVFTLLNVNTNPIVLKHESASSTDANRFNLPGGTDITLGVHQAVTIFYDFARWKVMG